MEEAINTECLRSMAPHWSLAGDKKLLSLLQDIHQKIMTRCQETSTNLEEMAITLDGANIDLQNVNNRFMALSNCQFVESRVYDDDLEVSVEENPTKTENAADTKQDLQSELDKLKHSLSVLESMHESVRILESDSDSDSDEGDSRMVYRPKDLYSERPLPHIIGSQAWKSKWHAGILAEDSDSDSTTSKPENEVLEQYSESESELTDTRTDRLNPPQRTISSNSSTVDSEPSIPPAPLSQANIAAELARKLAGNLPEIPVETPELEPEPTKPRAPSQVYKPQNPPTSNIFFDEPPPIDQSYQSDKDDYNDEEDDIFAELHKTKPSFTSNKDQTRVNQDLFGDFNNTPDVAADLFGNEKKESSVEKNNETHPKESDKKPIGGISVFGSSKGTESIGAAILKRNQRKTYSSDEESEKGVVINKENTSKGSRKENIKIKESSSKDMPIVNNDKPISEKKTALTKERDILQDIFDKNKPTKSKKVEQIPTKEENDLFSDNLFDDIDDIFTDTIVKVPTKEASKNAKSIFDEDNDDLFADIAVTSQNETISKSTDNRAGGLFDSDNDDYLFSEGHKKSDTIQKSVDNISKAETETVTKNKKSKGIFEDDSEEDIFSEIKFENSPSDDIKTDNLLESVEKEGSEHVKSNENNIEVKDDDNNNSFSDSNMKVSESPQSSTNIGENILNKASEQVKSIFDDDQLNNSSQNSRNVSLFVQKETPIETSKINSEFGENESEEHLSDKKEDSAEDDWDDDFTNSKQGNIDKFSKLEDGLEDSIKTEKTTAPEKQFINVENSDLKNDMLTSSLNVSLPKDTASSESGPNSEIDSIENSQLPTEPSLAGNQKSDIFNDIFNDIPPAFEKPKEPKKSKNVNALFDDDSDDEALFFKKNDIISDDKPDSVPVSKEDSLFSIFSDEPPAIDVDFTQKTTQSRKSEIEDKHFDLLVPDDSIETLTNNGQTFPSSTESQNHESLTEKIGNNDRKKTIGKLKSMNINIDVNSLLPGASPKKNKVIEQVDGQVASSQNINPNDTEESESKVVKSVSFDGEADSELLDNKLSKERAKIQVKRRPSTRRARREAVKKSGIDFATNVADDTNSVDIADASPDKGTLDDPVRDIVTDSTKIEKDKDQNITSKIVYILNDEDIFSNSDTNKNASHSVVVAASKILDNSQHLKSDITTSDNDDIFKKINVTKVEGISEESLIEKTQNQKYNNNDKSDNVFLSKVDKEDYVTINSKEPTESKPSIFDDISDEESELFQGKKSRKSKSEVNPKKTNIFGSDSEEELFANNVKKLPVPKEEMQKPSNSKVLVKKSLFDDDNDDDLFSSKTTSSGSKPLFSKAKEVKPIQTQLVDEDPLSILTNDEVNYI